MRINKKKSGSGPVDALTAAEQARDEALAPLFGEIRDIMEYPGDHPKYEVVYKRNAQKPESTHAKSVIKHREFLERLHYVVTVQKNRVKVSFDPEVLMPPDPDDSALDPDLMEKMIQKNGESALAIVKEHKDRHDLSLKGAKADYDKAKRNLQEKGFIS